MIQPRIIYRVATALGLAGALSVSTWAGDFERERRLTDEVEANLFPGELVTLDAKGTEFAAVEMASQTNDTRRIFPIN